MEINARFVLKIGSDNDANLARATIGRTFTLKLVDSPNGIIYYVESMDNLNVSIAEKKDAE